MNHSVALQLYFMTEKENQLHTFWAEMKDTFKLNIDYAKLTAAEKMTVLFATVSIALIGFVLVSIIVFFFSLAVASWIAMGIGHVWAYFIICGFYVLVLVLAVVFRKQLIVNPIAGFISRLFFNP